LLIKNQSRFLSLVLRHKPDNIGIKLDKSGWVSVNQLLEQMKIHGREISFQDLKNIVAFNDKKRFEFNDYSTKIRASQGHSIKVNLDLKSERPPTKLYHGTVEKAVNSILDKGLDKMKRHAVHLSEDIDTANIVGGRRGKPIILEINSQAMYADNIKFYKSKNGVWLTDNVPPKYIKLHE